MSALIESECRKRDKALSKPPVAADMKLTLSMERVFQLAKTDFCLDHLAKNVGKEHFSQSKVLAFLVQSSS